MISVVASKGESLVDSRWGFASSSTLEFYSNLEKKCWCFRYKLKTKHQHIAKPLVILHDC